MVDKKITYMMDALEKSSFFFFVRLPNYGPRSCRCPIELRGKPKFGSPVLVS